ncbi:LOW QUALITY PROTEIN: neuronal acetylcholine receptor subunit alpha-6-like [Xenia sp. Carnegie-2017]|uniref:LOW QUALITY PROTEIN: neuronal acetylcholine receptor subunit alpha-6-like n=1 Tax=Xenia sp. Carnegie-2017 TaxID=2897299 RepID=UPI001F04F85B|nr:LOW QUALITY PROTEIN: neuronal acetylcholine receptor subunit alpha-6-like [Xenia sp. Carnegie-2017]
MLMDSGLLIPIIFFLLNEANVVIGYERASLIKDLMKNYNADVRPFNNGSNPVKVWFSMTYKQLQNLNEPTQVAISLVWARAYWTDVNLKWNASKYGYKHVEISSSKIWTPDLTLYNNANKKGGKMLDLSYKARVKSNGNVKLLCPLILESVCPMNVHKFPYDTQKCQLKIGSWAYDSSGIDLRLEPSTEGIIMSHLEKNSVWNIKLDQVSTGFINYTCCEFPFHNIIYTFEFQRKPRYYRNLIISPTLVLIFNVIVFCFPTNFNQRIFIGVTALTGQFLFLIVVSKRTPATSDSIPLITEFIIYAQIYTILQLLSTAFIMHLNNYQENENVPEFCRLIRDVIVNYGT